MRFSDAVGSIDIDVSHLQKFLSTWYNEGDNIVLVGFPAEGHRRIVSMSHTRERLLGVTNEEFDGLTRDLITGQKYNSYIGINPVSDPEKVKTFSRGTEENVRAVYGCFIDFDVNKENKKAGVFDSKDEILRFIDTIPLEPTIVVDNGSSGGMHAYWRFEDPIDLSEDSKKMTKPFLVGWWTYIRSLTDKHIDRLVDVTRISRLPSGIYWPSAANDQFDTVKVVRCSGKRYPRQQILDLSAPSFQVHKDTLDRIHREKTVKLDLDLQGYASDPGNSERMKKLINLRPSNLNLVMAMLEDSINRIFSWQDILEPHGWTFLKEDSEGSGVWSRPGKSDRSAVVDFRKDTGEVSPVMSLLSTAEETRLSDLKEAGVVLTKMQVMLRLQYDDNVVEMLDDVLRKVSL